MIAILKKIYAELCREEKFERMYRFMDDIKISIVVPAYNVEEYIVNTVHSICAQTYQNLEIILVNDGSKDDTPKLLDKLAAEDCRIKVIHKNNEGVTKARLSGVEAASGEWIGFVDGDDSVEPEMYEFLIKNAIKYRADISHCGYKLILPSRKKKYYGTDRLEEQDKKTGLKDLLEGGFIEPSLWNKLFHKKLFHCLLQEQKMDLSIKNNEDLLMNYYLFQMAEKSIYEDKCLYNYVLRKNSATTTFSENKLKDGLKVLKILVNETESDSELQKIVKSKIVAHLISNSTMLLNKQPQFARDYQNYTRKELRKMFPEVLADDYSLKQKIMVSWAVIWPFSYGIVHALYGKIRNYDRDLKEVNSV